MCYFVEINLSRQELEKRFNVPMIEDPRYMQANIFPAFSKPHIPVITSDQPNSIQIYQWGLIPSWVKDMETANKIANATFNARAESIFEKASFRKAARSQRCMVLAHGFFEWHTQGKEKTPFYIKRKDDEAFAFAGLYENWKDPESGRLIKTISIITTEANPLLKKIHNSKNRMPVILSPEDEREYINSQLSKEQVEGFFKSLDEKQLEAYPINKSVFLNHKDKLDPELLKPSKYNPLDNKSEDILF
ncbi:MAG: SOS response-associated peptidase [Bacteroidales bacterium]|nr:SOS response-associated peptidase [Bacteroidales bacterium]